MKCLLCFTGGLIFFPWMSLAQGTEQNDHWAGWASVGIGTSRFGPTVCLSGTYAYNNTLLSFRYLKADEFRFNVEGHYDEPPLSLKEAGILIGQMYHKDILALSVSAGIAVVNAIERGKLTQYRQYEREVISTLALPFEFSFRFESGLFGIGGAWYGNINPRRSNSGALLQISFGSF